MHKVVSYFVATCILILQAEATLFADGAPPEEESIQTEIEAFTARVVRDRVRLRLQPTLESPVIRELDRGDMLVITGKADDFYAVQPPTSTKAYVYRTYVLDGVIEGNRVNVRLDPHLEAPVIAQLQSGDQIDGVISPQNNKWLEIATPNSTRFYIASDYVEKIGDTNHLARHEERRDEVNNILNSTYLLSQSELQKPFTEMEPEHSIENYHKVINEYSDFPEQTNLANEFLAKFQDDYLQKKVAYLEEKTQTSSEAWKTRNTKLSEEMQTQRMRLSTLEQQLEDANNNESSSEAYENWVAVKFTSEVNSRMRQWIPTEMAIYEKWNNEHENLNIDDFYEDQRHQAVSLRGILESYDRPVRNKPGDFLLVNRANNLPIAYIYSTQVNLHEKIGQEITVDAVIRPNNNFAYPAYFILTTE